jgi:hypothetical protein
MLRARKIVIVNKKVNLPIHYRFNIKDPVRCVKGENLPDAFVLSKYTIKDVNYYKVGNSNTTRICKELELIMR